MLLHTIFYISKVKSLCRVKSSYSENKIEGELQKLALGFDGFGLDSRAAYILRWDIGNAQWWWIMEVNCDSLKINTTVSYNHGL